MTDLAEQIEAYLREQRGWVKAADLVRRFNLRDERHLRAIGDKPGLCSAFAISGNKGFRHIEFCSDGEWHRFSERIRQHGIAELVRVKRLRLKRSTLTKTKPPVTFEKVTGQAIFSLS